MGRPNGKLHQRRMAYHEAGHAVMHVIFFDKIHFAQLNDWDSEDELLGFVRTDNKESFITFQHEHQKRRYLESRILTDMAGLVSQYHYPSQKVGWWDLQELFEMEKQDFSSKDSDFFRVYERLETLTAVYGGENQTLIDAYESFLLHICRHILSEPPIWKAVKTIAEKLLEQRKMTGQEIYDVCYEVEGFEALSEKFRELYLGR